MDGAGGQDLRGGRLCSITALLLVSTWSTLPAMRMVLLPSLSANAPARNRPSTAVSLRILTGVLLSVLQCESCHVSPIQDSWCRSIRIPVGLFSIS